VKFRKYGAPVWYQDVCYKILKNLLYNPWTIWLTNNRNSEMFSPEDGLSKELGK
jgi:hypothetical protein